MASREFVIAPTDHPLGTGRASACKPWKESSKTKLFSGTVPKISIQAERYVGTLKHVSVRIWSNCSLNSGWVGPFSIFFIIGTGNKCLSKTYGDAALQGNPVHRKIFVCHIFFKQIEIRSDLLPYTDKFSCKMLIINLCQVCPLIPSHWASDILYSHSKRWYIAVLCP